MSDVYVLMHKSILAITLTFVRGNHGREGLAVSATAAAVIFPNCSTFTIKGRLSTRSACPHYRGTPPHGAGGDDSQQNMDAAAVQFLQSKGVKYIISANSIELSKRDTTYLRKAGIGYLWLPVPDFHAPTLTQFREAFNWYVANPHGGVHFYCGWGNGRTGTYITGIEILEGVYPNKPTRADYDRNRVENSVQRAALDDLWAKWRNGH